jgi:hypothetical protein
VHAILLAAALAQLAPVRLPNSTFELGVAAFGDVAPVSTLTVPNNPEQRQMSVYTGIRLLAALPLSAPWWLVVAADGGYVAAGHMPGDGNDGVMAGAAFGAEYEINPLPLRATARLRYQIQLAHFARGTNGTLADWVLQLQLGLRIARIVEGSVFFGRDYAGGFAPGIGLAIGYF